MFTVTDPREGFTGRFLSWADYRDYRRRRGMAPLVPTPACPTCWGSNYIYVAGLGVRVCSNFEAHLLSPVPGVR